MSRRGKVNLIGEKVGRWTVTRKVGYITRNSLHWECVCDCGNVKNIPSTSLLSKRSRSCGCLKKERDKENHKTHGYTGTRIYAIWAGIIRRCYNKNEIGYEKYGGRGIIVCQRWRESFEHFLEDMGHPPTQNHSIDRIDVNGNYEPGNCRWASLNEQARNKRMQKELMNGVIKKRNGKWMARICCNRKEYYLGTFEHLNDAIEARRCAEIRYWGSQVKEIK